MSLMALTASASALNASIVVQELFDNISSGDVSLNGAGDTATSIGMTGNWLTNESTGIYTANNFNVNGSTLPGLPSNDGANGGVWNNTGSWNTGIYATRPLATPIDFSVDRTIYFSVRLNNPGDSGMGIGLASGSGPTDEFIGAGFTWDNAFPLGSASNIAGNSAFISHGTLGTESGPYGIRVYKGRNTVNGFGLLVGKIAIKASGDDTIQLKRYAENSVIDNDLDAIVWSVQDTVDSSMVATQLLLWMNGGGSGELDAIRVGDTWTDVTGVTLAGNDQPALSGSNITSVTGTSAQASVNLFTSPADMTLFWDTEDQGTGGWSFSNPLGNQAVGPVAGDLTGLAPDTRYYYRFQGVNTVPEPDLEAWSEPAQSFTTALTGLAVTDLFADSYSSLEVDLSWSDSFNTETGFIIQRSPAGIASWVTVGTTHANTTFHTDRHTGLAAETSYDYRILATNASGPSDPSNISNTVTPVAIPLETALLVNFDGTLDGQIYNLADGEIDNTGSIRANGNPTVSSGLATLNPGNELGPDGFDIDPSTLGNLADQNWVAEALVTYHSSGGPGPSSVVMDVQGDCNLRLRSDTDANALHLFFWDGSTAHQKFAPLPPSGVKVHLAYAWNATNSTLTGYINGVSFGSASGAPFAIPDPGTLSFGYFGRTGYEGGGIDGTLDAIAFQFGTATINPATDFLILPASQSYASWIGGYAVGAKNGFTDDADGDGLPNGIEGYLGTNPSSPDGRALTEVASNGTITTFTHPLANPQLNDIFANYQWSPDLVTWYDGDGAAGPSGGPTVVISKEGSGNGMALVTATGSVRLDRIFLRIAAAN